MAAAEAQHAEELQRGMAVFFDERLTELNGLSGIIEYVYHEHNRIIVYVPGLGLNVVLMPEQLKAAPGWKIGDSLLDYFRSLHQR